MQAEEAKDDKNEVSFGGGNGTAVAGILAGLVIAVAVPLVLLSFGQALGATALLWLVVLAVAVGGGVSIVSAFFGLVMPHHVRGRFMQPDAWREFAREARAWEHARHGHGRWQGRHGRWGWQVEEIPEADEAPARPARPKRRRP